MRRNSAAIMLSLGLGLFLGGIVCASSRRHTNVPATKGDLQKWENEGGSVPDVGTVSPGSPGGGDIRVH